MHKIGTASQMRNLDRLATESAGIPSIILMENAAFASTSEILKDFNSVLGKRVACFCGKGNNGGDGFAIARLLSRQGADVYVYLTHGDDFSGDAKINYDILLSMNCKILEVPENLDLILPTFDIVVDAIFGTGIHGIIDDEAFSVIEDINSYSKYILSVDIPSGISADTGEICGICVRATKTVTFAGYKLGQFLYPGADFVGKLCFADICIPDNLSNEINKYLIDKSFVKSTLPKRSNNSQKGDYGKILIIGGSTGLTGAVVMAAEAALKSGAGLVTVAVPSSLNYIFEDKLTEAMSCPLADENGHLSYMCIDKLLKLVERADIVLFGPGIGRSGDISQILKAIAEHSKVPLIIDADGITALAQDMSILEKCTCELIFTPHEAEMSRLIGESIDYVADNRIKVSESFAQDNGLTLVLKGHHTIVTAADGKQYINNTGNPGMATGGSGDVLAGMISALSARGISCDEAAAISVYLHGKSADIATEKFGENSITALDIINNIPFAFKDALE